jgi:ATP-dependent RNA helicase DOB1
MGIQDEKYTKLVDRIARTKKALDANELYQVLHAEKAASTLNTDGEAASSDKPASPKSRLSSHAASALKKEFTQYKHRLAIQTEIQQLDDQIKNVAQTVLKDELKCMMRVLRRLDYIDKDNLILRKGTVACEITTSDENELLLTELLFKGIFNDMETEMIVALLSCLVNEQQAPDNFSLPEEFQEPLKSVKDVVNRIASVSLESGVIAEKTGNKSGSDSEKVCPGLMEVTYKWAKGAKFIDLVAITTSYEGEIVRMMRRLEEMLRQLAGAAKSPAIGSKDLHDKFLAGIELIKRGIVFASSLYL